MTTATMYTFRPGMTAASERATRVNPRAAAANNSRPAVAIPEDQLYYWSEAWQRDERESLAQIERGEGHRFSNVNDLIRWLMEEE